MILEISDTGQKKIAVDSTQLEAFLTCPTQWKYAHKEQIEHITVLPSEAIMMGGYGHFLFDKYYRARSTGVEENFNNAYAIAVDTPLLENEAFACILPETRRAEVRNRFLQYTAAYGGERDFKIKSPQYSEVGFSHCIFETDEKKYVLEGRIDLLDVEYFGQRCFADHKFQLKASPLYGKSIQFRNYALIALETLHSYETCVINYIRFSKEITQYTFQRQLVSFTADELQAWKQKLIEIFDQIAYCVSTNEYPQRFSSCAGKYNSLCQYTPLCEQLATPELVQKIKDVSYKSKRPWSPW